VALAMHGDSGESGSILPALARGVLLSLVSCACVSCIAGREPRAKPAAPEAPASEVEPPGPESVAEERDEPVAGEQAADEAKQDPAQDPEQEPAKEQDEAVAPSAETEPPPEQSEETPTPVGADDGSGLPGWIHGSLSVRYRGRTGGDDQDHEARGVLTLDLADPSVPWVTGHLMARMDVDLEGLDEGEVFEDLSDTYDESVVAKLYLAYADLALGGRPEESPGMLRVGRQSDPRLPEVLRLDGASYLTRPMGQKEVELGVYGGIPVHLYESSPEGDLAFGTFVEGRPWRGGRARFDWMHLEDELVLGDERDDLLALALWHDLPEHWRFEGEFSHLEGDPRDLRVRALYDGGDSAAIVRASYYELLETQTSRVTELDPFYEELLELFPYRQATLNGSQAFGEHTVVDVGFDLRRVSDSGDVGEFNRDWERYYATATLDDLFAQGLALSVTADRWDDDDRDTSSFGADASYAADERWKAAIGSYYSLYKYTLLELDEREDVRTYYLRASHELSARLELDLLYEFEDDDLDTYHTLRLGALWRF
jgi:hypothetical protein